MDKKIEILEILNKNNKLSQRKISDLVGVSVGKVNGVLKELYAQGYIQYVENSKRKYIYNITDKAIKLLEDNLKKTGYTKIKISNDTPSTVEQAVILAAGKRNDFLQPVGTLELEKGMALIDRTIHCLYNNGINDIIIVTGYKSNRYEELKKFNNIKLINNSKYKWTGTMASLALAEDVIKGDFVLIESDLLFEERAIEKVINYHRRDCAVITQESGSNDESFVELRNDFLFKISKDVHTLNKINGEFAGITKISFEVFRKMLEEFSNNKNPYINYEYTLLDVGRYYDIGYINISDLIWAEVDNKEHYDKVRNYVYPMIKRKELDIKLSYLKSIISEALIVDDKHIKNISHLSGMNNDSFKINIKNREYVLRIPGIDTDVIINRFQERLNSKKVETLGISPKDIYFDTNTGVKICNFISKAEPLSGSSAKKEENMVYIAMVLNKLHNSDIKFENTFNFINIIELYERLLDNNKIYYNYKDIKRYIFGLYSEIKSVNKNLCPCHNDLVPENIIKSYEEKIYLVDLEFSAMNDPLWDVASFSLECDLSRDEEELFLRLYFKKDVYKQQKKCIFIYKILQDFLWSLWAKTKEIKGEHFGSYGIDRYNRMLDNIKKLKGNEI